MHLLRPRSSLKRAALMVVCLPVFASATDSRWIQAIKRDVFDKVQISGYRDLSMHFHTVTGDRTAFDSTNYYGQGRLKTTNIGNLRLEGRNVLGLFNFSANVQDSRYSDPQNEKLSLDYSRGNWEINAGDLRSGLIRDNRYANLNKTLKGFAASYKLKKGLRVQAVRSEVKGSAKTISITGSNSSGPYYVGYSSLVPGSEQVMLNGNKLFAGADYAVDYVIGTITLVGRTLTVTDSMVVSFEAFSFGERRGTVDGLEASYDMKDKGRLSVTALRQSTPGSGATSNRLEQFQGFGAETAQYPLQFEPLNPAAVTIYLNGVLQTQGVDYYFSATNPSIFYFTRFISLDSTINVLYTPKPRGTVNGDRENLGIDYRLPIKLGKSKNDVGGTTYATNGALALNQTFGKLKGLTPTSGTARSVGITLSGKNYDLRLDNRNIPTGFVAVESVGFNRNEDANDLVFGLRPNKKWKYELSRRNSAVTSTSGTNTIRTRFSTLNAAATFNPGGTSFWTLSQGLTRTRTGLGETSADTTDFMRTDQAKEWSFTYGLTHLTGAAPINATTRQSFSSDGIKFRTSYLGLGPLTLSASTSFLNIKQGSTSGKAKEIELNTLYRFSPKSRLNLRYFNGNGGAVSSLNGFTNGYGSGYDGSGFTSGSTGSTLGGVNTTVLSTGWDYQPSERFGLNLDYAQTRYDGGISSNSTTRTYAASTRADFGKGYTGNFIVSQNHTSFLGSPQTSKTTSMAWNLDATPKGRLNYGLNGNIFLNSSSSSFSQNGHSYSFDAGYFLKDRQRLLLSLNSIKTSGSYAQDESFASLTYQYQIWQNVALRASFVHRLVNPQGTTAGGYRANSLDIGLSFNFGR